jgi:hypothetical protein
VCIFHGQSKKKVGPLASFFGWETLYIVSFLRKYDVSKAGSDNDNGLRRRRQRRRRGRRRK